MKKFLTFLIVLIIVIAIIWIVLFVNKGRIIKFTMEKGMQVMHAEIIKELPSTQKAHVDSLFSILDSRVKENSLDPEEIKKLASSFKEYMKDRKIDSREATSLIKELEKITEKPLK